MFNLLTNALPDGGRMVEIPEALLYALIGFLVVFAGISLLIAVVWAVGKIMSTINPMAQPKKIEAKTEAKPKQAQVAPVVSSDEVDEETVAVITAALMAYYQTNNPKCGFTVKRIKRI